MVPPTAATPRVVHFATFVDSGCNQTKRQLEAFRRKVLAVLQDPKGWAQFGYRFTEWGRSSEGAEGNSPGRSIVRIYLTCPARMRQLSSEDGLLQDLNLCDIDAQVIYVHSDRWRGVDAHKNKAGMSMDDYQTYVINHEMGHALGCNTHLDACLPDGTSPIMRQQTLGQHTAAAATCTPHVYPTPLDFDTLRHCVLRNK